MRRFFCLMLGLTPPVFAEEAMVPIQITIDFCESLNIAKHKKTKALDISNEEGNEIIVPSDFGDDVSTELPKVMTFPLKLDLKKYFGIPVTQSEENHRTIETNLKLIDEILRSFQVTFQEISMKWAQITENIKKLQTNLNHKNHNHQEIRSIFLMLIKDIQVAFDGFETHPANLEDGLDLLSKNLSILTQQYTAYEDNAEIMNKNNQLRTETIAATDKMQDNLEQSVRTFPEIKRMMDESRNLLLKHPSSVAKEFDLFLRKFEELESEYMQTFSEFTQLEVLPSPNIEHLEDEGIMKKDMLSDVRDDLEKLNFNKGRFVDTLEIGDIEIVDSKLYFNSEPLGLDQEKVIRQNCKKLMS